MHRDVARSGLLYHVVPHWADGLVTRDGKLPKLLIHIDGKSMQNRFYADVVTYRSLVCSKGDVSHLEMRVVWFDQP